MPTTSITDVRTIGVNVSSDSRSGSTRLSASPCDGSSRTHRAYHLDRPQRLGGRRGLPADTGNRFYIVEESQ